MIQVRNLHVEIGRSRILKGIDLDVRSGQLVALIGANGAGKTTLIRALSGLLSARAGTILFCGAPVDAKAPHLLARAGLVHVPQGRRIIADLTVEENLLIGSNQNPHVSASSRKGLLDGEYRRFPALWERRRVIAGALSGGEQQMLAISRGLMMLPKVLMLDEPSLGLAPRVVETILRMLRSLVEDGLTVLLVEQAAYSALRVADHAYVLRGGRVILAGPSAVLLADPALLQSYLG